MLVLSRKRNESIVIDSRIIVTVVELRGDKVRLGINAPTEVPVHRQEVYSAIEIEGTLMRETPEEACRRLETTPLEEMTRSDLCRRIGMLEQENEDLRKNIVP